jgi:hypothetical protein
MNFAAIVPTSMLDLIKDDEYQMALAPICVRTDYRYFYRDTKGHLILDNGLIEGRVADPEGLLQLAVELRADEVIAPDAYKDMERTLRQLRNFMPVAAAYNVMAVLQARTWKEFDVIMNESINLGVASVALPRVLGTTLGGSSRLICAELIRRVSDIPIHALGSTEHLTEGVQLAQQGIVRGLDSSAPVVQGLYGKDLGVRYTTIRPKDFFSCPSTPQAVKNLQEYRKTLERQGGIH